MAQKEYLEVGIVKTLYRYPVKSLAGEAIEVNRIGWHGLEGDRRFAFLKLGSKKGFPWLTARDVPQLVRYQASLGEASENGKSMIQVTTPDGKTLPITSPELLAEIQALTRYPIHLLQDWGGVFDAMDISLISLASIAAVDDGVGGCLDIDRFRPNIVVEAFDTRPFPEERWLKDLLIFGDQPDAARIRINRKTLRCMVVNLDSASGKQNPAVLKQIVQTRKNQLGVYGTTERPGMARVGDVIRLLKD